MLKDENESKFVQLSQDCLLRDALSLGYLRTGSSMTKSPWEGRKWEKRRKRERERERERDPLLPTTLLFLGVFPNSSPRTVSFFTMHGGSTKQL